MEKIDFVIPWVDNQDEQWRKEKDHFLRLDGKVLKDAGGKHRYRGLDILQYVLRSIEVNCPWYNKIYLITKGHYPDWLDLDHPKIKLITHEELFFNKDHLPTFSSRAIEMNLPNLSSLSDKFIHLNDDMLFFRKIGPERFFLDNKPVDYFSHGWVPRNKLFEILKGKDVWVDSLKNNISLINRDFYPYHLSNEMLFNKTYPFKVRLSNFLLKYVYKKIYWIQHWHLPQPYLKSTVFKTYDHFSKEMMVCSANKFRKGNDVNPYLYRYTQLVSGNFAPRFYKDSFTFQITNLKKFKQKIEFLNSQKHINLVCFNDSQYLKENEYNIVKDELEMFLNFHFPSKATFEI